MMYQEADMNWLRRATSARNGAKFAALWRGDLAGYPSASEADLALVLILMHWHPGASDDELDGLMRQSGRAHPKWEQHRGQMTYGQKTIYTARQIRSGGHSRAHTTF